MYGTIARMRAKPGKEPELLAELSPERYKGVPGYDGIGVYRMDSDQNEFWVAVGFESKKAYVANAESPEQTERYRRLRELLLADPEWHDGEIVFTSEA